MQINDAYWNTRQLEMHAEDVSIHIQQIYSNMQNILEGFLQSILDSREKASMAVQQVPQAHDIAESVVAIASNHSSNFSHIIASARILVERAQNIVADVHNTLTLSQVRREQAEGLLSQYHNLSDIANNVSEIEAAVRGTLDRAKEKLDNLTILLDYLSENTRTINEAVASSHVMALNISAVVSDVEECVSMASGEIDALSRAVESGITDPLNSAAGSGSGMVDIQEDVESGSNIQEGVDRVCEGVRELAVNVSVCQGILEQEERKTEILLNTTSYIERLVLHIAMLELNSLAHNIIKRVCMFNVSCTSKA